MASLEGREPAAPPGAHSSLAGGPATLREERRACGLSEVRGAVTGLPCGRGSRSRPGGV